MSILTPNRIYIITSDRFPGRYKIGVSTHPDFRLRQVTRSLKPGAGKKQNWKTARNIKNPEGKVVFEIPMNFAYEVEWCIHRVYAPLNTKMIGDGHTEWFTPMPLALLGSMLWTGRCWWEWPDFGQGRMVYFFGGVVVVMGLCFAGFVFITAVILFLVRLVQLLVIPAAGIGYWYFFMK